MTTSLRHRLPWHRLRRKPPTAALLQPSSLRSSCKASSLLRPYAPLHPSHSAWAREASPHRNKEQEAWRGIQLKQMPSGNRHKLHAIGGLRLERPVVPPERRLALLSYDCEFPFAAAAVSSLKYWSTTASPHPLTHSSRTAVPTYHDHVCTCAAVACFCSVNILANIRA